ncbi:MAG: hypothetical protein ACKVZH_06525 [Blastocatellia bacterium]
METRTTFAILFLGLVILGAPVAFADNAKCVGLAIVTFEVEGGEF